jgi:hypothetical protein
MLSANCAPPAQCEVKSVFITKAQRGRAAAKARNISRKDAKAAKVRDKNLEARNSKSEIRNNFK